MTRIAETTAREAKIAELKRLITSGNYETIEKLEDAVDAFLWSEADRLQSQQGFLTHDGLPTDQDSASRAMARAYPR